MDLSFKLRYLTTFFVNYFVLANYQVPGNDEPYSFSLGMKRLDNLSRSLRGKAFDQIDTSSFISKVKDLAMSYLTTVSTINGHLQSGNEEEAAAAFKAALGEGVLTDSSIVGTQGSHEVSSLETPDGFDSSGSAKAITLQDISDKQVAQFLEPQMFGELTEHTRDFVDILDGIKLEHLNPVKQEKKTKTKPRLSNRGEHKAYSNPPNFLKNPGIEHTFRQRKSGVHGTTPSIMSTLGSSFLKDHRDFIMAKHQVRQKALEGGFCPVKCEANEWECNCQRLFSCVNNMDSYDLAVLIAGG